MGKVNEFINALTTLGDGRYHYWNGSSGIGCSDYVRMALGLSGIITPSEANDSLSLWAIHNYKKVLDDASRFKQHSALETPKDGWIEWYALHHVSVYYSKNGAHPYGKFEAAPESSHGICDGNGKTGVGYWSNHNYNCSGGALTCYYEIIEDGEDKMKNTELVSRMENICNNYPTHYRGTNGSTEARYNIGAWDGTNFCFDCSGLIKSGGFWGWNGSKTSAYGGATYAKDCPDINDQGFYNACEMHQISNISDIPVGALLWKQGHVGVYIGNGYAIECTPAFNGGVQKTSVSGRGWTHYGIMPWVEYDNSTYPTLQKGSNGVYVQRLQQILNEKISAGLAVDGSFGDLTLASVKNYQTRYGLVVDGIVGNQTWASLMEKDEIMPEPEYEDLTAKQMLSVASDVYNGTYKDSVDHHKHRLTELYGEKQMRKIQDLINLAES